MIKSSITPNELQIIRALINWDDEVSDGWKFKDDILGTKKEERLLFRSQEGNFWNYITPLINKKIVDCKKVMLEGSRGRGRKRPDKQYKLNRDKRTFGKLMFTFVKNDLLIEFITSKYFVETENYWNEFADSLYLSLGFEESKRSMSISKKIKNLNRYKYILNSMPDSHIRLWNYLGIAHLGIYFFDDILKFKSRISRLIKFFKRNGVKDPYLRFELIGYSLTMEKYIDFLFSTNKKRLEKEQLINYESALAESLLIVRNKLKQEGGK